MHQQFKSIRIAIGVGAIAGLVAVFVFQRFDIAAILGVDKSIYRFLINRSIRFFINDAFSIALIYALFFEKRFVVFALWVQAAGILMILVPYFILKLYFASYNGPLISYFHRLIMNPVLLLLLIPAFYYQKNRRDDVN